MTRVNLILEAIVHNKEWTMSIVNLASKWCMPFTAPDLGTIQIYLNRINWTCKSFELIKLMTQAVFPVNDSIQRMIQVFFF